MDALKSIAYRHLTDPTTYAGIAALLVTYLPVSATGIDASQWEKVIGVIVGLGLVWIDGRTKAAKIAQISKIAPPTIAFLLATIASLALSACGTLNEAMSAVNNYSSSQLEASKSNVQAANDNTAKALSDALCAIPYGELVRNGSGNPAFPGAVIGNCGLPSGFTMIHQSATTTVTTGPASITVPSAVTSVTTAPVQ